jgi:hypothetical protein
MKLSFQFLVSVSCLMLTLPSLAKVVPIPGLKLYSLQEGLNDALSEELQYVGYYMPFYSDSQKYPVCLFRNSKVLVMSDYCVKEDVAVASFRIHPVDSQKGFAVAYAETGLKKDISQAERKDYFPDLWFVASQSQLPYFSFQMSLKAYQQFDAAQIKANFDGCIVSQAFASSPQQTFCTTDYASSLPSWSSAAFSQWQQPSVQWFQFLKMIRAKVRALPDNPY